MGERGGRSEPGDLCRGTSETKWGSSPGGDCGKCQEKGEEKRRPNREGTSGQAGAGGNSRRLPREFGCGVFVGTKEKCQRKEEKNPNLPRADRC